MSSTSLRLSSEITISVTPALFAWARKVGFLSPGWAYRLGLALFLYVVLTALVPWDARAEAWGEKHGI